MSQPLPAGWALADGADLFEHIRGVSYKKHEARELHGEGLVPVLRAGNLQDGRIDFANDLVYVPEHCVSDEQRLRSGDLIVAMSSGSRSVVGKVGVVTEDRPEFAFGAFCGVLRPRDASLAGWLDTFTQSRAYRNTVSELSAGININNLKREHLFELKIPLAPTATRRRIVQKIEAMNARSRAAREALEQVPSLLERFRQSVLAAAFRGDLSTEWRKQNLNVEPASALLERVGADGPSRVRRGVPEAVPLNKAAQALEIPESWSLVSVAELLRRGALIDLKDGNHGSNHPTREDFTPTGLPFVMATQVHDYQIDYDGASKVAGEPLAKLKVGLAHPGDVIFTHKGTIGRVAICERDCVLTPQTTYYRVNQDALDRRFLMHQLESPMFYAQFSLVMSQTTRDYVPISEQYRLFVAMPPLAEQMEVARRVASLLALVGHLQRELGTAANRLAALDQAILAKAFRGELVAQDPNDEPASVLLERIRAERGTDTRRRPGRRKKSDGEQLQAAGSPEDDPPPPPTPTSRPSANETKANKAGSNGVLLKAVLDALKREALHRIADAHEVELADRRSVEAARASIIDGGVALEAVLEHLDRDELKAVCRARGLEDRGKTKEELRDRITHGTA